MPKPVITVDKLSKSYRIGHQAEKYPTFRDALVNTLQAPLRRLRRMSQGGGDETFWALKDVSFEVQRGEVVGIIGRNGAGKSTLLKILSQITEPTTGEVRMRGRVASLLEVGTGFHPELTGRENIYLNGAILGMKKAEITRKFDEIVAFAEVEKFLDTPVKRYSSGMYVRLAFAVAAHLEPEILIVDEVLAVGDAEFQKKCLGKMQEVSKGQGRTVLFVSHNMAAVRNLCKTGIVLRQGVLLQRGDCESSISTYTQSSQACPDDNIMILGKGFDYHGVYIRATNGGIPRTNESVDISIAFCPHTSCNSAIHLYIEDQQGAVVIGLDSRDFMGSPRIDSDKIFSIVYHIASLPLIPGSYRLRMVIRNDSTFSSWEVPVLAHMQVEGTTAYGNRQLEQRWHGTTFVQVRVSINRSAHLDEAVL